MPLSFGDSDVTVIFGYNKDGTYLTERGGTTSSGKARKKRFTLEVKSEPLLLDLDELMLGAGPAEAIQELISSQISHITQDAKPATVAFRARAARDLAAGKPWARKRYGGGRTGVKPPGQGAKLFNDSGRLAEGIFVRQNRKDNTFTVNVPANRLDPSTFSGGAQALAEMTQRLVKLVPALDPRKLSTYQPVKSAISKAVKDMVAKADNAHAVKLQRLRMARNKALKQIAMTAARGLTT